MREISGRFCAAAGVVGMVLSLVALAQEEELPTLKLDRVMASPAFQGQTRAPAAPSSYYAVQVVAADLAAPWALAFLPDGRMLITENAGQLRIVARDGTVSEPLKGLPPISTEGWAGLFDVALDPAFDRNRRIYFSYAGMPETEGGPNVPRVARARLDAGSLQLTNVEIIVDGAGFQELHFAADGSLLVSGAVGLAGGDAQDLTTTYGKLLRLNADGSIPVDNPFVGHAAARAEIYSYGHRDISGIATHPVTGDIWITEHGARGGDELNLVDAGRNYGWEVISYGTQYTGAPVGNGQTRHPNMVQPRYFWRPSIAPSGLVFYTGDMFPEWRGSVLVTALSGQHIARLELAGDRVVAEERLMLDREQRIRELRQGPDGALYALTTEASDAPKGTAQLLRIHKPAP